MINKQNWIRNRDLEHVTIVIYINDRGFKLRNNPYRKKKFILITQIALNSNLNLNQNSSPNKID